MAHDNPINMEYAIFTRIDWFNFRRMFGLIGHMLRAELVTIRYFLTHYAS